MDVRVSMGGAPLGLHELDLTQLGALNRVVVAEIKQRRYEQSLRIAANLRAGDRVRFNRRNGTPVTGVVRKVNPTTAKVVEEGTDITWSVSLSLLTKIKE